jgi:hypothetical protein
MNPENKGENEREWTIGELMQKMGSFSYPEFIPEAINDVQEWMNQSLADHSRNSDSDFFYSFTDDAVYADMDKLVKSLEWVEKKADLLPGTRQPEGFRDAVILCIGPSELEDGIRAAIDHSAIFSRGSCKNIWLFCDSWILGDIIRYSEHLKVLSTYGVTFHFMLVTPWGWAEIPVSSDWTGVETGKIDWKKNGRKGHSGTSGGRNEDEGFQQ